MRRLVVLLLACGLSAAAAGCGMGGGSGSGSPGAPSPSELVRQAFAAAEAAGSFNYSVEATLDGEVSAPMRLTVTGASAERKARADVSFTGGGESLAGSLLYDGAGFFVKFMGRWYGEQGGLGPAQGLEQQFGPAAEAADLIEGMFEGTVTAGPVADGVPTWAFNGRLNVDWILERAKEEGSLEDDTRERVEELADTTRVTILFGKADALPRSFLVDMSGEGADLMGIGGPDGGTFTVTVRGSFSRWGEPVEITPPSSYAPLHELFDQLFSF
jgi:hypothetical protein